jgi:uncharacterized delta-60 repeat protein
MTPLFRFAPVTLALLCAPLVRGAPVVVASPSSVAPAFGATVTLAADVTITPPASYGWTRSGTPILDGGRYAGASTSTLIITGANNTDNGDYTLTVTDASGTAATTPATVTVTHLSTARDSATTSLSSNSTVGAILHLPDGRTLVGGNLNGAGGTTAYSRLAIVGTDYRVTPTPLGTFDGTPSRLVRQPDGKILVLGPFTTIGGLSGVGRTYLARLNADLTLDPTFLPLTPNNVTTSAVVDAQGRIYLGGNFTLYNGQEVASYLVRLLPDGRFDSTFSIRLNGNVTDLVMQADGKILVGGSFQTYGPSVGGTAVQSLIRLTADGSYDSNFTASYAPGDAFGTGIKDLAFDSQQRLLVASFHLGSATPYGIFRLLSSGAKDPAFVFTESLSNYALAIQPVADDKVLVGGNFTTPANKLIRLVSNGSRDTAFTTDLGTGFAANSSYIQTLAPDPFGRLWLGGDFTTFKSTTVNRLLVLQGESPALAFSAQPVGSSIDIGGTATFTAAATGNNGFTFLWLRNGTLLADGGRISGATTATLTITGLLATDAADYTVVVTSPSGAATFNRITSAAAPLIVLAAPEILTPPLALTRDLGGSATFNAAARGAGTLSYQWLLGTTPLTNGTVDGVTIAGATTPTLTVNGLTFAQAGGYRLRVTNNLGETTSASALLTVQRRPAAFAAGVTQPLFDNDVYVIRPLADGSTLVGGAFTSVTISGVTTTRNRLVRLLANGTLDATFAPSFNNPVRALEVDSAGRVFVGGDFTSVTFGATTTNRTRLARLTSALALDPAFDTSTAGPNNTVRALAPIGDGSVYVGGLFTQIGAVATPAVSRLALLNAAGALDPSFTSYAVGGDMLALVRLADGTLYAAGTSTTWNSPGVTGSPSASLIKLSATGMRDTTFTPPALVLNFFAPKLERIQLLADGSLLAAGNGTSPAAYLKRFNATTGAEVASYSVGHTATVLAIAQQADGKILSGSTSVLSRVTIDGNADPAFNVGAGFNNAIRSLAVDASGRSWVGGAFTTYDGVTTNRLAILNGGDFESQSGPPTPQPITFPTFLANAGVPANLRGPNDDADNDGLDNLIEYALDLNPNGNGGGSFTGSAPTLASTPALLQFTYRRVATDVTYVVETSPTLTGGTWTTVGVTQGTPTADGTTTASIPITPGSQFLRLAVSLNP